MSPPRRGVDVRARSARQRASARWRSADRARLRARQNIGCEKTQLLRRERCAPRRLLAQSFLCLFVGIGSRLDPLCLTMMWMDGCCRVCPRRRTGDAGGTAFAVAPVTAPVPCACRPHAGLASVCLAMSRMCVIISRRGERERRCMIYLYRVINYHSIRKTSDARIDVLQPWERQTYLFSHTFAVS
jgi:hypothetical protein